MDGFCKLVCENVSEDDEEKACDQYINSMPHTPPNRRSYQTPPMNTVKTPPPMMMQTRSVTPSPYRFYNPEEIATNSSGGSFYQQFRPYSTPTKPYTPILKLDNLN